MPHNPRLSQEKLKTVMGAVLESWRPAPRSAVRELLIKTETFPDALVHKGFLQERKRPQAA